MKNKYLFTLLVSAMLLASCGGTTTPNSQPGTSPPTSIHQILHQHQLLIQIQCRRKLYF